MNYRGDNIRFREIQSTHKIVDKHNNRMYDAIIDNNLFILINEMADENEKLKLELKELKSKLEEI